MSVQLIAVVVGVVVLLVLDELQRRRRRQSYRTGYLRGEHWSAFRRTWWERHPGARCAVCGAGRPLDLHHRTYARIGRERDGDVVALCRVHHDAAHGY